MTDKTQESLNAIAVSLRQCFNVGYHQDILISSRYGNNLFATWWFDRENYTPRRWEVSILFPRNIINRYVALDDAEKNRAKIKIQDTVTSFVLDLESLEEGQIKNPASYICELDGRMFD